MATPNNSPHLEPDAITPKSASSILKLATSLLQLGLAIKKLRARRRERALKKMSPGNAPVPHRIRKPHTDILRYAAAQRGLNTLAGAPDDASGSAFAHAVVDHLTSATKLSATSKKALRKATTTTSQLSGATKKAALTAMASASGLNDAAKQTAAKAGEEALQMTKAAKQSAKKASKRTAGSCHRGGCAQGGRCVWTTFGLVAVLAALSAVVARILGIGSKQKPAAEPPSIDDVRPHSAPESTLVYSTSTPDSATASAPEPNQAEAGDAPADDAENK